MKEKKLEAVFKKQRAAHVKAGKSKEWLKSWERKWREVAQRKVAS